MSAENSEVALTVVTPSAIDEAREGIRKLYKTVAETITPERWETVIRCVLKIAVCEDRSLVERGDQLKAAAFLRSLIAETGRAVGADEGESGKAHGEDFADRRQKLLAAVALIEETQTGRRISAGG